MTRLKLVIGISSAVVVLAGGIAYGYWWSKGPPLHPEISDKLALATQSPQDSIVDLRDHAAFPWTDVFIMRPYTSKRTAEMAGVSWPWRWNHIAFRDHFVLFVFVDSQRVVGIVEHPRQLVEFATDSGPGIFHYSSSDARFPLRKADSSYVILFPKSNR